jgi:hypothetical protein
MTRHDHIDIATAMNQATGRLARNYWKDET